MLTPELNEKPLVMFGAIQIRGLDSAVGKNHPDIGVLRSGEHRG